MSLSTQIETPESYTEYRESFYHFCKAKKVAGVKLEY